MSYDRSFGADRHDLRSPCLDMEDAGTGLIGRAARAARRILGRTAQERRAGAALSRIAGRPAHDPDATARS